MILFAGGKESIKPKRSKTGAASSTRRELWHLFMLRSLSVIWSAEMLMIVNKVLKGELPV